MLVLNIKASAFFHFQITTTKITQVEYIYKFQDMNTTTSLPAMAMNQTTTSSSGDFDFYISVIERVFSSAGRFLLAIGFWLILGLALTVCVVAIALLLTIILRPFVAYIHSSQETAINEGMRVQRQRDLEANVRANAADVPNEQSPLAAGAESVHGTVEEVIFTPSTEKEEEEEETDEKASSAGFAEHDDSDLNEEEALHEGKSLGSGPVNFH